jgi:hypothetical protein
MISDEDLRSFNQRGFIPGPSEDEQAFLQRIAHHLNHFSFRDEIREIQKRVKEHFDIQIDWMQISYSNQGLSFWEGAAVRIEETEVVLQLRKAFEKGSFLKIYKREEVLAHEWVHLARMAFDESQFEELFAYSLSPHFFRRWLGPFFQTYWEAPLFLILWSVPFFSVLGEFFFSIPSWFVTLPYFATGLGLIRLCRLHFNFLRCRNKIKRLLKNSHHAAAFLVRLTDKEICLFGRLSLEEIKRYIDGRRKTSLRWRTIALSYCDLSLI